MAVILAEGKQQYTDSAGAPLAGGQLWTYAAGTSTPLATYSDSAGTAPNTNPVTLDARGEAAIYWAALPYKVTLKDAGGATIWTVDNITSGLEALASTASGKGAALVAFQGGGTVQDLASTASGKGAALVGYLPAVIGAVPRTVYAELCDAFASVKDFGAVGDGTADDTTAVLAGVAYLKARGGGTLYFPQGTYKVTAEILLDSPGIMFKGTGRRKCYPGVFVPSANAQSTIMPVHSGRNCIRIFNAALNAATTLTFEDINFATLETGSRPTAAFGFDGSGNFHRDYVWERCGIHGFTSAFDTYNTGGDMAFGVARISHCTISRNNWIARNITGQWNGFVFRENEAGQNLTGGFDLKGHSITIVDNLLEGQPDVIKVSGNYRGTRIEGNYFESTSGSYTLWLSETIDAHVGKNTWITCTSTEPVRLYNDVNTRYLDTMPPSTLGSWLPQLENNVVGPTGIGSASCAVLYDSRLVSTAEINSTEIGGFTTAGGANASPHKTIPNSVGGSVTTSGTGILTFTKAALSLPTGTWFAVAIAVSYDSALAKEPVMELRVNSGITDGYANPVFYNFSRTNVNVKDRTVIYWGVVKATNAVTSFQVIFYPYGISPAAGLTYTISQPEIYNMGTTLPTQRDGIGITHPSVPHKTLFTAAAVPSAGTWQLRHQVLQSSPAAAGFIGWVCTTAGTPGTWKTFGAISP
jgi:hypothetical protein